MSRQARVWWIIRMAKVYWVLKLLYYANAWHVFLLSLQAAAKKCIFLHRHAFSIWRASMQFHENLGFLKDTYHKFFKEIQIWDFSDYSWVPWLGAIQSWTPATLSYFENWSCFALPTNYLCDTQAVESLQIKTLQGSLHELCRQCPISNLHSTFFTGRNSRPAATFYLASCRERRSSARDSQ